MRSWSRVGGVVRRRGQEWMKTQRYLVWVTEYTWKMMLITKKRRSKREANLERSLPPFYNREYNLAKVVIKVNNHCSSKEDKWQGLFSINTIVLVVHMKICCYLVHCIDAYMPGLLTLVLLKFGLDNSWLWSCPVNYRIFASIPGLYPLGANSNSLFQLWQPPTSPGINNSPLVENHCYLYIPFKKWHFHRPMICLATAQLQQHPRNPGPAIMKGWFVIYVQAQSHCWPTSVGRFRKFCLELLQLVLGGAILYSAHSQPAISSSQWWLTSGSDVRA